MKDKSPIQLLSNLSKKLFWLYHSNIFIFMAHPITGVFVGSLIVVAHFGILSSLLPSNRHIIITPKFIDNFFIK